MPINATGHRPVIEIPPDGHEVLGEETDERELQELIGTILPRQTILPQDLQIECTLGRGSCSYVQRALHRRTRQRYAIKVFNAFDRARARQLVRELSMLGHVSCPSLVGFHGVGKLDDRIHVVLEYMDRGSLHSIIQHVQQPLPEVVIASVAFQILWGLGYLHFERRLHRDVKPSNILVNSSGEVKLSDFGIATEILEDEMALTMVGTFRYMSPERLRGDGYAAEADIWSLGLVMAELASQQPPFHSCFNQIELNQLLEEIDIAQELMPEERRGSSDGYSSAFREFVESCVCRDPQSRLPAEVLLDSPLFQLHSITELDVAVQILKEWLDDNPDNLLNRSHASTGMGADDAHLNLVTTWNSSNWEEDSDGEPTIDHLSFSHGSHTHSLSMTYNFGPEGSPARIRAPTHGQTAFT